MAWALFADDCPAPLPIIFGQAGNLRRGSLAHEEEWIAPVATSQKSARSQARIGSLYFLHDGGPHGSPQADIDRAID